MFLIHRRHVGTPRFVYCHTNFIVILKSVSILMFLVDFLILISGHGTLPPITHLVVESFHCIEHEFPFGVSDYSWGVARLALVCISVPVVGVNEVRNFFSGDALPW